MTGVRYPRIVEKQSKKLIDIKISKKDSMKNKKLLYITSFLFLIVFLLCFILIQIKVRNLYIDIIYSAVILPTMVTSVALFFNLILMLKDKSKKMIKCKKSKYL